MRMSGLFHNPGYYVATICRLDGLLMGSMLALLLQINREVVAYSAKWIFLLASAGLLVGLVIFPDPEYSNPFMHTIGYTLLALLFASLIAFSLNEGRSLWKSVLSSSPLRFLGKYSYGIYVFHFAIYWMWKDSIYAIVAHTVHYHLAAQFLTSMSCLLLTTGTALISFHLLEQPFLRLKKYFLPAKV
jgi:peptidoglycan/LPS O-acetylase OafA/YrhL